MTREIMPKVSICIPTYNYGCFITDAIESVLAQSYSNYELFIADNCSTDNTREIVERFVARDERISYLHNETNLGMVGNWNLCLHRSKGEFFKLLCADDVLDSSCIEKQVAVLESCPNVSLVASGRLIVDEVLSPVRSFSYSSRGGVFNGEQVVTRCLFGGNYIGEPTAVMFRKKQAQRGFDNRYHHLTDLEMWFHLLEQGDLAVLSEPLCKLRHHNQQSTRGNVVNLAFLADENLIFDAYKSRPNVKYTWANLFSWKFKVAYNIWIFRELLSTDELRGNIQKYMNFYVFLLLMPTMSVLKKIIKLIKY